MVTRTILFRQAGAGTVTYVMPVSGKVVSIAFVNPLGTASNGYVATQTDVDPGALANTAYQDWIAGYSGVTSLDVVDLIYPLKKGQTIYMRCGADLVANVVVQSSA